ncbi:hypothetical protein RI845_13535 [Thalassotalea nanhaiensis]|uniref:Uncharacterized protein n=1 Tax=Thalassotalea nanhaiensis TaxID=3065648 RepID=A0ABY9TIC2_9GAMM|nr:hypothetical protein RI845_13535 [Colwelliaceae bacterium SQ345]
MSLRDKLRTRQSNITVLGSDKENENVYGLNATSNENKLAIWNDLLKSERTQLSYGSISLRGVSGTVTGKREYQMMSMLIGDTLTSSTSVDIAKRYIDTYDKGSKHDNVVFNEGNYKAYGCHHAKKPFIPSEMKEESVQVYVVDRVDTQTGEKIGRYVKMTKSEAADYHAKQTAEYKAGKNTIETLMGDPSKRAKLEALLAE